MLDAKIMIDKILADLKERGCIVGPKVPGNDFNDKFIDVNGVTRCARDLERLDPEHFEVVCKEFTTFRLTNTKDQS